MFDLKDVNPKKTVQEDKTGSTYLQKTYAGIANLMPVRRLDALKRRVGQGMRTAIQISAAVFTVLKVLAHYMLRFLYIRIKERILPFMGRLWQTVTARIPILQTAELNIVHTVKAISFYSGRFIGFVSKKEEEGRNPVIQAARAPLLFGVYIIGIFVAGGGLWSAFASLHSAAIAPGAVVPDTNKKTIQSLEGGVVKAIFVKQGDRVKAGDKLVEFEDIRAKPQYEASLSQYRTLLANEARLAAERDGADSITFPPFLTESNSVPEVAKIIHTQENLFRSKQEVIRAETESSKQKILQLQQQIEGQEAKKITLNKTLEVLQNRLKSARQLQEKGFTQNDRVLELEAQEAQYVSEVAVADTEIAKSRQEIIRSNIEILNLQTRSITQTLQELKETQGQLGSAAEQYLAAREALKRTVLTSPVDGIVHTVYHFTTGGVINPGYPVMEILPVNDRLVIEARVNHKNIDAVHTGLTTRIKFGAFKAKSVPLFDGRVIAVSPDVVQPQNNMPGGIMEPYYNVKVEIDMNGFNRVAKEQNLELYPGMQAEVQIITGTRTMLRYIFDPVLDTMFRSYR